MKQLRLAKVSTLEGGQCVSGKRVLAGVECSVSRARWRTFPISIAPLTPQLDLAAILCHVEERVIGNDYTFSFAGRRYQIAAGTSASGHAASATARGTAAGRGVEGALSRPLPEHRTSAALRVPAPSPAASRKPARKDHNAGGKSAWMQGFFDRPAPAAVEVDRRSEVKPFGRRAFLDAQSLRSESFTRSNVSS